MTRKGQVSAWKPPPQFRQVKVPDTLQKWENVGDRVEGEFRGVRDGKFGSIMDINTEGMIVAYPVPTMLLRLIESSDVQVGDDIIAVYTGETITGSGFYLKVFELYIK